MSAEYAKVIAASNAFGAALADLGIEGQPVVTLSHDDGMLLWTLCEAQMVVRDAPSGAAIPTAVKWMRVGAVRYEWPAEEGAA